MRRTGSKKKGNLEIHPDEIFIDSANMPAFDRERLEGRIERPIGKEARWLVGILIAFLFLGYTLRAGDLMYVKGAAYAKQAAENQLSEKIVFTDRGIITDRTGIELAFNDHLSTISEFSDRVYTTRSGVAHVVGYVKAPAKDASGIYYRSSFEGIDGVEEAYDAQLRGENGRVLTEVNARGEMVSQSTVAPPKPGQKLTLSIDARVSEALYEAIKNRALGSGFQGGAGVIMDVKTGELLALTSFPEFSLPAIVRGDAEALTILSEDKRQPFLDRAVDGLYAPGSIIKPIVAAAALQEGIIDERTEILSTGALILPNPYDPSNPSVFKDWKAHGYVDMRRAIGVSSDVYFYQIGGGFGAQKGLGIQRLERYFRMFGFGADAGLSGMSSKTGTIPTPEWKEEVFKGDPWRIGNTYHTSIGQYGLQVTPLQVVRAIAAVANGGRLVRPTLVASSTVEAVTLPVSSYSLEVAREGMRMAVTEGTATAVNLPFVAVAGKTGTAQVGARNEFMNSWMVGFFPYENPRYAYAIVLERAPAATLVGAPAATSDFFWWMNANAAHYLQSAPSR